MKKSSVLLAVILCMVIVSITSSVFAEVKTEVNSKGEIRTTTIIPKQEREVWADISSEANEAKATPGKEIPINPQVVDLERVDFFHYVDVKTYDRVVVFENNEPAIINKVGKEYGDEKLIISIILMLVSIATMLIFNLTAIKNKDVSKGAVLVTLVASASAFALVTSASASALAFAFLTFVFALATNFTFAVIDDTRTYKILSALFYTSAIIFLFAW